MKGNNEKILQDRAKPGSTILRVIARRMPVVISAFLMLVLRSQKTEIKFLAEIILLFINELKADEEEVITPKSTREEIERKGLNDVVSL